MFSLYLNILNFYWRLVAERVDLPPTDAHKRILKKRPKVRLNPIRVNFKKVVCYFQ